MTYLPALLMMTWCCNTPAPSANATGAGSGNHLATLPPLPANGKWYGPVTVKFDLPVEGSPYDAVMNDVRVRFTDGGSEAERLAYFDGKQWCAVLLSPSAGAFRATVTRNGSEVKTLDGKVDVSHALKGEFVRIGKDHRTLVTESGAAYWPLGHCFGWQGGPGLPTIPEGIKRMTSNGMNWSRIWACNWDGKNPFWPNDHSKLAIGDLWQPAFSQWDAITSEATTDGLRFQWVLFHHGEVSSTVDPNWNDNPWSTANGGFLDKPEDFFTNARAKQLAKNYLRYVIARYSHQTGILGWELFNEVENTSAARNGKWDDIEAWHREMASYVRSIDPYQHPVITSSEQRPGLIEAVDIAEPHGYPSDVGALLLGSKINTTQPFFYGEVGLAKSNPTEGEQRKTIRDAIWGAYLAGHSGAGQYWYWDVVQRMNLDDEFAFGSSALLQQGLHPGPAVRPLKVDVEGDTGGDLVLRPGISWGPSLKREFDLPAEGGAATAGKISSFLQGTGHADMGSEFKFKVKSPIAGKLTLHLGTKSKGGAHLHVFVDGASALDEEIAAGQGDTPINKEISASYPAGDHEVLVRNDGPDWVTVDYYTFSGLGKPVDAVAAADGNKIVVRIQNAAPKPPHYRLRIEGASDGTYQASFLDLVKKTTTLITLTIKGGWLTPPFPLRTSDGLWVVKRK